MVRFRLNINIVSSNSQQMFAVVALFVIAAAHKPLNEFVQEYEHIEIDGASMSRQHRNVQRSLQDTVFFPSFRISSISD